MFDAHGVTFYHGILRRDILAPSLWGFYTAVCGPVKRRPTSLFHSIASGRRMAR